MAKKRYTLTVDGDEVESIEIGKERYMSALAVTDPVDRARVERMVAAVEAVHEKAPPAVFSTPMGKVFLLGFGGIAALMILLAVIFGVSTARSLAREQTAPGRVVRLVTIRDSEGTLIYYPEVQYTLPNGESTTMQMNDGASPPAYEVGQKVTMRYDPDHPSRARIDSLGGSIGAWTVSIITGALGLAFTGAAFMAYWILKA